jgi:hypothetical protein
MAEEADFFSAPHHTNDSSPPDTSTSTAMAEEEAKAVDIEAGGAAPTAVEMVSQWPLPTECACLQRCPSSPLLPD